ncbi:hypothetical protein C825_000087 [Parabacteroides sp. ASF519]|nr:hypothetical protein [Parabacteroides sp. ASF519]KAI4367721.1 hypothetical protein C825_000087 [Parabacteroides sp. ASF519]
MERYSARVNLDQKLSKYVKMGVNLNVSRNQYDNIPLEMGRMKMQVSWFRPLSLIQHCLYAMKTVNTQ